MASKDHIAEAISRIITQYTEADTVSDYLTAVLEESNELEQVFCDLIEKRSLDTAEGVVLDQIGAIVGQPRPLIGGTPASDEEYIVFIRARIVKNTTRATLEDIIAMVYFIFEDVQSVIVSEADRAYLVNIGKSLTSGEAALLLQNDLMPKPIGIGAGYGFYEPDRFFQLTDLDGETLPGGSGLGDVGDPLAGGFLSTVIF